MTFARLDYLRTTHGRPGVCATWGAGETLGRYPPKGVSMQVIDEASGMPAQGTLLTPQQEQSRLDADKLIIANVPLPQSRGFRFR